MAAYREEAEERKHMRKKRKRKRGGSFFHSKRDVKERNGREREEKEGVGKRKRWR